MKLEVKSKWRGSRSQVNMRGKGMHSIFFLYVSLKVEFFNRYLHKNLLLVGDPADFQQFEDVKGPEFLRVHQWNFLLLSV